MAKIYYGLDREYASDLSKVPTRATSTTNLDVEVVVDDAAGLTRTDMYRILKRFAEQLKEQGNWPAGESDFAL